MVEIDTLFKTKTAKKNIPFGAAHTYIAYIRDYSPPPPLPGAKNALQIMSRAASTQARLISLRLVRTDHYKNYGGGGAKYKKNIRARDN